MLFYHSFWKYAGVGGGNLFFFSDGKKREGKSSFANLGYGGGEAVCKCAFSYALALNITYLVTVKNIGFSVPNIIFAVTNIISAVINILFAVSNIVYSVRNILNAVVDILFVVTNIILSVRNFINAVKNFLFDVTNFLTAYVHCIFNCKILLLAFYNSKF